MNVVVRRRLAAGAAAVATAVIAGFLVSPIAGASATGISSLSPNTAFNTETKTITINLAADSDGVAYPPGSTVTFTRQGTSSPADSFSVDTDPDSDPTVPTVTPNFADVGSGVGGDGPANVGTYNVHIEDALGAQTDDCTACFGVLAPPSVTVTKVDPNAIAANGSANVTVTGSGFSRGVRIEVLQSDDTTPDSTIKANDPPTNSSGTAITSAITTPTTIQRRWTVGAATEPGPRDVRVTNTDGTSAVCPNCFFVNGPPLTGVSPLGSSNDPNAGPVTITFSGTNLNSGIPRLEFVGTPGSSTKTDLAIEGKNPSYFGTSVSAEYDLRNAAPGNGAYQPTLTQTDGSQNTCGCRFSIDQATSPVVKSLILRR